MKRRAPTSFGIAARRRFAGFTLVELLVAIAVIGILAAVAFPSLMDSIRKSRRSDAFAALAAAQQAQERWRSNNSSYASTLSTLNVSSNSSSSYYTLSIPAATATGYEIVAEGNAGTSQANDACRKLGIQMSAGTVKYAGCASCSTLSYATTHTCWAR